MAQEGVREVVVMAGMELCECAGVGALEAGWKLLGSCSGTPATSGPPRATVAEPAVRLARESLLPLCARPEAVDVGAGMAVC